MQTICTPSSVTKISVHKVCWCTLCAHIEQTKYIHCAYIWVYFNSVLNIWHFGVIEMSYTSISTCFLYKPPGQKHLNLCACTLPAHLNFVHASNWRQRSVQGVCRCTLCSDYVICPRLCPGPLYAPGYALGSMYVPSLLMYTLGTHQANKIHTICIPLSIFQSGSRQTAFWSDRNVIHVDLNLFPW